MEVSEINNNTPVPVRAGTVVNQVVNNIEVVNPYSSFIKANTQGISLNEISNKHIIPVFIKDNEPVISHTEFIQTVVKAVKAVFPKETVLSPSIRISHPVKGRVPEAKHKAAKDLQEREKTIYYERMAFTIEIPSISTEVGENKLNLTIGGIKAYNLDNLYCKSTADQHFKVFIGFKNMVCTNLCISTDGYLSNLKVKNINQLYNGVYLLLKDYNAVELSDKLKSFINYNISERQFANLVGRCRMYRHMPEHERKQLPDLMFGDSQINTVCKDYYSDNSFCSNPDGSINLWKLYNLFTNANKSSYVDYFMDRNVNAYELVTQIQQSLGNSEHCWFLN